ncbi:hypothetical protein [Dactylosporangium sp. NPDC049140]|uniref:hypothetical protein n=1 Tax=Dactylosporangium sp. NPDC049140 TaxID=3155647 RepID=UPI0033F5B6B7
MRVAVRLGQAALVVLLLAAAFGVWRSAQAVPSSAAPAASLPADLVLGPDGIGRLRLGMSEQAALDTGESRVKPGWQKQNDSKCFSETTAGKVNVMFSNHHGLAVLSGPERTRTPEGIRAGATVADIAAAYPTIMHPDLGTAAAQVELIGNVNVPVPGNPAAIYVFFFRLGSADPATARLQVILLSLLDQDQECTRAD